MDRWIAVYDTPDNTRRRKLAKTLDGYGDRVQYSVFELLTDGLTLQRLLWKLERIVDPAEDSLRLYPACAACAGKVLTVAGGLPEAWEQPEVYIV